MKSVLKISSLFLIFIITILIILNLGFFSQIKLETFETIRTAQRNVLKGQQFNIMYEMSAEDMELEMMQDVALNSNADVNIDLDVLDIYEKGLVDSRMHISTKSTNGKSVTKTLRNTMIVEQEIHD